MQREGERPAVGYPVPGVTLGPALSLPGAPSQRSEVSPSCLAVQVQLGKVQAVSSGNAGSRREGAHPARAPLQLRNEAGEPEHSRKCISRSHGREPDSWDVQRPWGLLEKGAPKRGVKPVVVQ